MDAIMMGLICGGVVLIVPLFALVKASGAAKDVDDLKRTVQRLEGGLDRLRDQFADAKPASPPLGQAERPPETKPKESEIKQAALAKPEPKHFTLPSDFKESREARLAEKQKKTPAPKPASVPPPIIQSPKPAPPAEPAVKIGVRDYDDWFEDLPKETQDEILRIEAALEAGEITEKEADSKIDEFLPSEPVKPEKAAATAQAGMPRLPKVDAESIEMKLGTYWFVRIGVMLVLTALGFLAYYTKGFGFIDLPPGAKVSLFYLLSAAMGGVGFWLQRTKEQLKNYGQVLLAGGFAGVYFTTYAAHVIEPVKIIDNATFALLLLFAWGGFMVWVADRLKSETIALFAIGASYYATYVPLIHSGGTGEVSDWVILFSNLVLAVAAVVFMLRNRWLKMPVLSLSASYAGFLLWRLRADEPSLTIAVSFAVSLWVVYTAAVFLSRSGAFSDRQRAVFLTANNAAMFALLTADVLKYHEPKFWILPMVVGVALLGCALAAARWLEDQSLSRKSYLTQGLVLVTLGLMTMGMAASLKGPILAAESVVLLFMAIRRNNLIIQIGSLIVVAIAAVYALNDTRLGSEDFFLAGLFTGLIFLFNARLCHARIESAGESLLRPRVSYLTGLALVVGLFAYLSAPEVVPSGEWVPTILLATTVLFTVSVYRLKIREFVLLGQVPGAIGLLFALSLAGKTSEFTWPLFCAFVLTLGQAHWWRWQRDRLIECCPEGPLAKQLPMIIEAVLSGGFVLSLLVWLHVGVATPIGVGLGHYWLWVGALVSVGMTVYAVFTRARFVGLFSQIYLLMSCWVMVELCARSDNEYATLALIPIATMYLMNIGIPVAIARIGRVPELIHTWVANIQLAYRIIAAALGLLWISNFVPDEWRVLVFIAVGVVFFAMQFLRPAREWQWLALAYAVIGYLVLAGQFYDGKAFWLSLVAIVALFGVQQLARRCEVEKKVPDLTHQWLILGGGALLFIWLSIRVSDPNGDGLLTIAWTILAVGYFGLGFGLKERWYRLTGLGTLALALVSLTYEFVGGEAYWKNLLAIGVLFGVQQFSRRYKGEKTLPDWVHQWLILVGGALLFIWLSIKVSKEMGGHEARTIAWSLLAVVYFGAGLGLRERWYRLMGLGTLAIALVSLAPIIWQIEDEIMRIASLFVIGCVFLGLGFVYTRYQEQLKKLL